MAFLELLVAPKSTIDDPNMRSNLARQYGHRSFCCIEDSLGECEGTTGYWVEDDNSGLVGFLEEFENEEGFSTFWLFQEDHTWAVKRFRGRTIRRGSPRRKGKGRGSKGRSRFRSYGKGKGRSRRSGGTGASRSDVSVASSTSSVNTRYMSAASFWIRYMTAVSLR